MSAAPASPSDARPFRDLMARWATGVAVVTARDPSGDAGLTVNALLSVSLHPPSLLISLTRDADTTGVIQRSGWFAVNFLEAGQRPLSERFARTLASSEKFQGVPVHRGRGGLALLDGTLGAAECRVLATFPQWDHLLFVGEVERQELGRDGAPLLFFRSGYGETDGTGGVRLPSLPGP